MSRKSKGPKAHSGKGRTALILCLLLVVMGGGYLLLRDQGPRPQAPSPEVGVSTNAPGAVEPVAVRGAFQRLVGRWMREDGGYVIEVSGVEPDGRLTAAYYNPRPIHVSRAAAVEEAGGTVKVGLELDDVGYPQCLYTLVFNPTLDQLQGTYFQAAQGQTFEVVFVRLPVE